jgi:hypothetical protein
MDMDEAAVAILPTSILPAVRADAQTLRRQSGRVLGVPMLAQVLDAVASR